MLPRSYVVCRIACRILGVVVCVSAGGDSVCPGGIDSDAVVVTLVYPSAPDLGVWFLDPEVALRCVFVVSPLGERILVCQCASAPGL